MATVTLSSVSKVYANGFHAVHDLSVDIKDSEFLGVFDTPQAAYDAGLNKWGNVPFLIKPVVKVEKPQQIPALYLGLLHAGT